MGLPFDLSQASIVAYLTRPGERRPPRLTGVELGTFLDFLRHEADSSRLLSERREWKVSIAETAETARKDVEQYLTSSEVLPEEVVERALRLLRARFRDFPLFAVAVGTKQTRERLRNFAGYVALDAGALALVLIPDYDDRPGETVGIFDPDPAVQLVAGEPNNWPGMLFWTADGTFAFAPLRGAEELYSQLRGAAAFGGDALSRILTDYKVRHSHSGSKRIVHISDLHFGTSDASKNASHLFTRLSKVSSSYDRIVITGDLFDSPRDVQLRDFQNFRQNLRTLGRDEPIVIPGNHDRRFFGNTVGALGRWSSQLADLHWERVVVDPVLQVTFLCFDSTERGDFATGEVTEDQLRTVAAEIDGRVVSHPAVEWYPRVALVHHHPYPYPEPKERLLDRLNPMKWRGKERLVRMDGADRFLEWCTARRVPLILHGHKHKPRQVSDRIRNVVAIGCGTSLGVNGAPMAYDLLSWSPVSGVWSASFVASSAKTGHEFGPDDVEYVVIGEGGLAAA